MKVFHSSPLTSFCLYSRKLSSSLLCVLGFFFFFTCSLPESQCYLLTSWIWLLVTVHSLLLAAFWEAVSDSLPTASYLDTGPFDFTLFVLLTKYPSSCQPILQIFHVYPSFLGSVGAQLHIKLLSPLFPFLFIFQLSTAPSWRIIQPILFILKPAYFLLTLNFLQHPIMVLQCGTA